MLSAHGPEKSKGKQSRDGEKAKLSFTMRLLISMSNITQSALLKLVQVEFLLLSTKRIPNIFTKVV